MSGLAFFHGDLLPPGPLPVLVLTVSKLPPSERYFSSRHNLKGLWVCIWRLLQPYLFINCWLYRGEGGGVLWSTWWWAKLSHSKAGCPRSTSSFVGWVGLRVTEESCSKGYSQEEVGQAVCSGTSLQTRLCDECSAHILSHLTQQNNTFPLKCHFSYI